MKDRTTLRHMKRIARDYILGECHNPDILNMLERDIRVGRWRLERSQGDWEFNVRQKALLKFLNKYGLALNRIQAFHTRVQVIDGKTHVLIYSSQDVDSISPLAGYKVRPEDHLCLDEA